MDYTLYIALAIIAVIIGYAIVVYNNLVRFKNRGENAFAQIDVQLKRRYDLIPNLIETAKGYLKHEQQTLTAVTEARNQAQKLLGELGGNIFNTGAAKSFAGAEAALGSALSGLNIAVEAYPDLKASANMMQLSEEMTSTENKIAFARQAFNDAATNYNIYRASFPPVLFAGLFGYAKEMAMLEFADAEQIQEAPKASFA